MRAEHSDEPRGLASVISDPATRNIIAVIGVLITGAVAWTQINSEIAVIRTNQLRVMTDIARIEAMRSSDQEHLVLMRIELQKVLTDIRIVGGELRAHSNAAQKRFDILEEPNADPAKK